MMVFYAVMHDHFDGYSGERHTYNGYKCIPWQPMHDANFLTVNSVMHYVYAASARNDNSMINNNDYCKIIDTPYST